jgi:cell wall-associated NlpC family hydrolase
MKRRLRFLAMLVTVIAIAGSAHAADQEQESFGQKVKHFFGNLWPSPGKKRKKSAKETPTPSPSPAASASPESSETATPEPFATATPSPTTIAKQTPASNATISTDEISDYDSNLPEVRKIIDIALGLTTLNLDYRYGSADPTNGGMDCSGFIYYVLTKCGVPDVPRDARDQYVWVRKAGNFQAVLAQSDDTFELNALQPGDLLFWGDTHSTSREPAITETMIYLGREKGTNQRLMAGASDGRTYKDQPRRGVSVVEFKVQRLEAKSDEHSGPTFVGYGRVPGLTER